MGMAKRKKRRKGECNSENVTGLMFWPSSGSWVSNSGKGVWGRRYWRKDFHGWPISLAQTEPTPRVLGQTAPPPPFFGKLADISREFAIILLNGLRKYFPSSVLFFSVSARLPSPWKIAKKQKQTNRKTCSLVHNEIWDSDENCLCFYSTGLSYLLRWNAATLFLKLSTFIGFFTNENSSAGWNESSEGSTATLRAHTPTHTYIYMGFLLEYIL